MANICTTIKQSKKLLELGLDPITSDMYWGLKGSLMHPSDEYELNIGRDPAIEHNLFSYREGYTIPAWSLSALLEIMPKVDDTISICIPNFFKYYPKKEYERYICSYIRENLVACSIMQFSSTNLIEAAYNMVIWLLENNYLPKSE